MQDIGFWNGALLDGYIVGGTPSELLSEYLGKPVLLVLKGPVTRRVEATDAYPNLEGQAVFQDGFPLFVATMESLEDLQSKVVKSAQGDEKWRVGRLDHEVWREKKLNMERCGH